ncbi:hypothetical protein LOTGIDRAFT_209233 [Lottia gigantea]|uniref:Amino acid permease/ SLC12A domain-containing protein n=1 Tax=Lottia gigantea TaxID=225164 RepID=V3ZQL1_LOTGI|nr:hypothetical protein LOTGIDRAFT_209233 [Lottia gigantea]ESO93693.1 hypothetical protein LOTGIDRAFT_209233 [Lottia gigantea]
MGERNTSTAVATGQAVELKKQISLFDCVTLIVGTVIGAGIFVSPVGILLNVQSVGMSIILWAACGLYSGLCAMCFAELGAAMPVTGGEYMYIYTAFGDFAGFLCLWIYITINYCVGYAALCLVFSTYILQPLYMTCEVPVIVIRLLSVLIYTLLTTLNCRNVKWVTKLQAVTTGAALTALVGIVIIGVVWIIKGETGRFENAFEGSDYSPGKITIGFYSGIFAYSGWNNVCMIASEIVKPQRNIPLSIIISLSIVTLVYIAVNIGYFAVLTPSQMIKSSAVAVTFAEHTLGKGSFVMSILIASAVVGTLNGSMLAFSRLIYMGANNNHVPQFIGMLSIKNKTPSPSLMFICLIVLILQYFEEVFYLIELSGFGSATVISATLAALLKLRWKNKLDRPFKLHISIPIIMFITSLMIACLTIYQKPTESGYAILTIALGVPYYLFTVLWKDKPVCLQRKLSKYKIQ